MEYTFKRINYLPVTFMICGIAMLLSSLITMAFGSATGFMTFCLSILFIGQAVWAFNTPIVKITDGLFYHNKGLLAKENFELKHVEHIDFSRDSRVDLLFFNGHIEKIHLKNLNPSDREEFKKIIKEAVEKNQITQ
jgi:hypothetical protein